MSMLYVALPVSLALAGGALFMFHWALRRGQFDDLQTPAMRILHEDEPVAHR